MTLLYAVIGAKALYLLFIWLFSTAGAAWMADRKGYGERVGLTFGLVLTFVGFIIVLLLPGRPGSTWKIEGPLPRRRRPGPATAVTTGPAGSGGEPSPGGTVVPPDDEPPTQAA